MQIVKSLSKVSRLVILQPIEEAKRSETGLVPWRDLRNHQRKQQEISLCQYVGTGGVYFCTFKLVLRELRGGGG